MAMINTVNIPKTLFIYFAVSPSGNRISTISVIAATPTIDNIQAEKSISYPKVIPDVMIISVTVIKNINAAAIMET